MFTKKLFVTFLALIIGVILLVLTSSPSNVTTLIACDVGQGDSILVTKGTTQILIDGGPSSEKVLSCLARHIPFWDRSLELVVFTNTDQDHLGGLVGVIPRYQVGKIVTGDGIGKSNSIEQFIEVIKARNLIVEQVSSQDSIIVGTEPYLLTLQVLWPQSPNQEVIASLNQLDITIFKDKVLGLSTEKNINERSVVLLLEEAGKKVLLTGDIGEPTERILAQEGLLSDIDILKVGHHGSKYSSSDSFLQSLSPELAIISVGKNNYGHPTADVLSRLQDSGATIRRTDLEGDIVVRLSP